MDLMKYIKASESCFRSPEGLLSSSQIITAYFLVPLAVDALLTAVTFYKVFQMKKVCHPLAVRTLSERRLLILHPTGLTQLGCH